MSATQSVKRDRVLYRFGPYEADLARNELRKHGLSIRLERKPWQVLVTLLNRSGELVTRGELQKLLWREDVFVDFEAGLNVAIKKVRAALSESVENPKYVETIPGEGYRFIADVQAIAALPDVQMPVTDGVISSPTPLPDLTTVSRPERKLRWSVALVCCAVLLMALAVMVGWWRSGRLSAPGPDRIRLVVLPFENLSGDPSQEFLSDGMTEELSARLGNLNPDRLGVIGRTSAMTYKQSLRTISQIGKELGVEYVLEGSVRRNGSKLRITAQLVKVAGQVHVWAQDYDRDMTDLLQMQDDVASDVARQVGVSTALGRVARQHVPNLEAHESYLLARYHWYKRTPEGWATAEQYFRRALNQDPEYADAYAGLAECHIPRQEAVEVARKAVTLDPNSGEAYTALGWVELYRQLDLKGAEIALKTALNLDSNYAPAHHIYSEYLGMVGQYQYAIAEKREAVMLDPLSPLFRAALADWLSVAGQNEQALEEVRLVLDMDARFPKAHEVLGNIYLRKGMFRQAIDEYHASEHYGGGKLLGILGYAYARSGDRNQALSALSELGALEKTARSGDVFNDLAIVEIGLGNRDAALQSLEKEYQWHDEDGLLSLKYDPIFSPLHSDPRYSDLLRRIGLPQ